MSDELRREVEGLLARLTTTQGPAVLEAMGAWTRFLARSPAETGELLAELLAATPDDQERRVECLVAGLAWRRGPAARERLEALLVAPAPACSREDVVIALEAIGDPRSAPALAAATALEDEFGHLRVKIAEALGAIGGALVRRTLEELARSELESVREAARHALGAA